jgi:hypothetical protein
MRTSIHTTKVISLVTALTLSACPDAKEEKPTDDGAATTDGGAAEPKPAVKTEANPK